MESNCLESSVIISNKRSLITSPPANVSVVLIVDNILQSLLPINNSRLVPWFYNLNPFLQSLYTQKKSSVLEWSIVCIMILRLNGKEKQEQQANCMYFFWQKQSQQADMPRVNPNQLSNFPKAACMYATVFGTNCKSIKYKHVINTLSPSLSLLVGTLNVLTLFISSRQQVAHYQRCCFHHFFTKLIIQEYKGVPYYRKLRIDTHLTLYIAQFLVVHF